MNDRWYNSELANGIGIGLMCLLICVGFGTCSMLENSKIEYTQNKESK